MWFLIMLMVATFVAPGVLPSEFLPAHTGLADDMPSPRSPFQFSYDEETIVLIGNDCRVTKPGVIYNFAAYITRAKSFTFQIWRKQPDSTDGAQSWTLIGQQKVEADSVIEGYNWNLGRQALTVQEDDYCGVTFDIDTSYEGNRVIPIGVSATGGSQRNYVTRFSGGRPMVGQTYQFEESNIRRLFGIRAHFAAETNVPGSRVYIDCTFEICGTPSKCSLDLCGLEYGPSLKGNSNIKVWKSGMYTSIDWILKGEESEAPCQSDVSPGLTGPSNDQTLINPQTGSCALLGVSGTRYSSGVARIHSVTLAPGDYDLSFYQHTRGLDVGALTVYIKHLDGWHQPIEHFRGLDFLGVLNEDRWYPVTVKFSSNWPFQLVFEAVTTRGPHSVIALDGIRLISTGKVVPVPDQPDNTLPFNCVFTEKGNCTFTLDPIVSTSRNGSWAPVTSATLVRNADAQYAFLFQTGSGTLAREYSAVTTKSKLYSSCGCIRVSFDYFIKFPNEIHNFWVKLAGYDKSIFDLLMDTKGDRFFNWSPITKTIETNTLRPFEIQVAVQLSHQAVSTGSGGVAIANLLVVEACSQCQEKKVTSPYLQATAPVITSTTEKIVLEQTANWYQNIPWYYFAAGAGGFVLVVVGGIFLAGARRKSNLQDSILMTRNMAEANNLMMASMASRANLGSSTGLVMGSSTGLAGPMGSGVYGGAPVSRGSTTSIAMGGGGAMGGGPVMVNPYLARTMTAGGVPISVGVIPNAAVQPAGVPMMVGQQQFAQPMDAQLAGPQVAAS